MVAGYPSLVKNKHSRSCFFQKILLKLISTNQNPVTFPVNRLDGKFDEHKF
ncbi:hypothetical protein HanPSC8_Chr10g0430691 [Helianthus annuus]|nr:hypothetical protein HanPSC8_Chr10g0430691 [Helianthus annuus]